MKKYEDEIMGKIEMHSNTLQLIAKKYPKDSQEMQVLKLSALVYSFVITKHQSEFEDYLIQIKKPLSVEELRKLESM